MHWGFESCVLRNVGKDEAEYRVRGVNICVEQRSRAPSSIAFISLVGRSARGRGVKRVARIAYHRFSFELRLFPQWIFLMHTEARLSDINTL